MAVAAVAGRLSPSLLSRRTSSHRLCDATLRITSWAAGARLSGVTRPSLCRAISALAAVVSPERTAENPVYDRLLPCPSQNMAPRIEHLVVLEGGNAIDNICKTLGLPPLYVADLIQFGAVHYALVCPVPPANATSEQVRIFKEVTKPAVLQKRSSIKGKTVREAQKTFRITDPTQYLEPGTYLRIHVHPKRFPRCYEIDWKSRVITVTDSYVVLDKPAGTSVGGTVDNIEECCATFTSRALGLESNLLTTHQIDNCSEGCVVFGKTPEFASFFHGLIREKKVKKHYLALAAAPVEVGIYSHYMRPVNMAPRIVSRGNIKGWHLCQLEVLECQEVCWPISSSREQNAVDDCGWPSQGVAYECKINLLTGKTHQIRAQFAAIGAPIVGDTTYMPAAIAEMDNPRNNPFGAELRECNLSDEEMASATEAWISCHGKEPQGAVGLQASHISWDDGRSYKAGAAWWQQEAQGNYVRSR